MAGVIGMLSTVTRGVALHISRRQSRTAGEDVTAADYRRICNVGRARGEATVH